MSLEELLGDRPFRLLVYGDAGAGKSTAVRKLAYELGHNYDAIVVNSYNAEMNPNYDFTPRLLSGNASAAIQGIIDFNMQRARSGLRMLRVLLIIEDYLGLYGPQDKVMRRLAIEGRQYFISTVTVIHRLSQLPTIVRDTSTHILFVGPPKLDQLKYVANFTRFTVGELREVTGNLGDFEGLLIPAKRKVRHFLRIEAIYATIDLDLA
jgi:energy-coupling factor transporter ATP-binding protein EcfA2